MISTFALLGVSTLILKIILLKMISSKKFLWLSLLCFCIPFLSFSQKTSEHNTVATKIAKKIQDAGAIKSPMRLAIVTFAPLQSSQKENTYGEYLTESIIGHLANHSDKVKIFERKRLDAILKENELMLSGMMKPSEALKIGELIPVDALFSGTYTKLKSYIEVSGRLIDVTSGEILMSYTGRVKLSKNIKTLFPENTSQPTSLQTVSNSNNTNQQTVTPPVTKESVEVICKRKTEAFNAQLHDLSTPERIEQVANDAMKTPFENQCGKLHYYFIQALSRYNLYPEKYKTFLLATLDTIAFPSGDDRANTILSFVARDREIDNKEWRLGFQTIKKIGDYTLSTYISTLFTNVDKPEQDQLKDRIDQYFTELSNNRIGLPRPIDYNKGFFEAMEGLNKNPQLRLYSYGKYAVRIETEADRVVALHLMYLKRMYNEAPDAVTKSQVMNWITQYFNKHQNKKSPEQLYDFAYEFDRNQQKGGNYADEYPLADLKTLIEKCRDKFSAYATETQFNSQKEDRLNFCVRYGIPVAGEIPTIEEADVILKGNDFKEQLRVLKLLILMGDQVRPLEKTLISILKKKSIDDKETLLEIQSMAIQLLGKIQTRDAGAIREMISRLTSFNYKESESSQNALVNIGKPAVPGLTDQLKNSTIHEGGLQYKLVVILGKIGKDAKPAEPVLKNMLGKTTNKDVRYAIEAALQEIE